MKLFFYYVFILSFFFQSLTFSAKTRIDADLGDEPPMFGGKIKHVIAIMFENRSFDHMIGFLRGNRTDINGCIPSLNSKQCTNPLDPTQPNNNLVSVNDNAVYIQPGDPDHSVSGTSGQIYGIYGDNTNDSYPGLMNGFIKSYSSHEDKNIVNDNGAFIMNCFNQSTLPIMSTLVNEFAVINNWYPSIPGPTEPNRVFAMMGTSQGMANNYLPKLIEGFVGKNIFELMDNYGPSLNGTDIKHQWLSYWQDAPSSNFVDYTRIHPERFHPLEMFWRDLKYGNLSTFSWIDPAYFDIDVVNRADDQHPDHDVTKGEALMKKIYEALRQSPIWNETLLLIYYDEHGGFFDHVPPPNAPNPDGINSTQIHPPFDFTRLGVRIPALLISPWIKKGTVLNPPSMNNGSQYCHSSLLRTMREQMMHSNAPTITKRTDWALAFDNVINLNEMRNDCPMTLPDVPNSLNRLHPDLYINKNDKKETWWIPGQQKNNEYQISFAKVAAHLCKKDDIVDNYLGNQASLGKFVKQCMNEWTNQA